jgi:hypothetical protein
MTNEQERQNVSNNSCERKRWGYGSLYSGVWVIIIGVIFLLNNFGYLQGQAWSKLWPVFIIIPGIFMILRSQRN